MYSWGAEYSFTGNEITIRKEALIHQRTAEIVHNNKSEDTRKFVRNILLNHTKIMTRTINNNLCHL